MTKKQFCLTLPLTVLAGFLGGLLAGFLFTAGVVQAQSEDVIPKVIRAESFEVLDSQGMLYARLGHGNEKGSLNLLEIGEEGPILGSYDATQLTLNYTEESGGSRISLASLKDFGTTILSLTDYDGNNVSLQVDKTGPSLYLRDEKSNPRLVLKFAANQLLSGISFYDQNGQARLNLMSSDGGTGSSLGFFDQDGGERVMIVAEEKKAFITFTDKYGNIQAAMSEIEGKGRVMP